MDITFEKADLLYSLGILQGVTVKNDAMPILSNLMIEASHDNGIQFTGNNLECGIKTRVDGVVIEEGKVIVNSKKFLDMTKELPSADIDIKVDKKHRLTIEADKGSYKIIGQEADEFPELPDIQSDQKLSVDALSLNMAIGRVAFAAHPDASNALNCIKFSFLEDRTEIVATKRSVCSLSTLPPLESSLESDSLVIPMKAVREINRAFSNSDEISTIITESWLLFTDGTSTLTSRIIEQSDPFPDYRSLLNATKKDGTESVKLMKDLFTDSLKRVLVLADPNHRSVKITFNSDSIQLTSNGPEIGDGEDFVDILDDEGFEGEISVDGDALLTTLSKIPTESVEVEFSGTQKPLLVNSTSTDIENLHTTLIMATIVK